MMVQNEPGTIKAGVEKIAAKTLDINQLLVSKVELKKSEMRDRKIGIDVTYHDPCHLGVVSICNTINSQRILES